MHLEEKLRELRKAAEKSSRDRELERQLEWLRRRVPALLHSLVWIMDERPEWIAMGVDSKELANALAYARAYAERSA